MYIHIKKKKKKKKYLAVLPQGGFNVYGTELIPLFPYLRAGILNKKGGGGAGKVDSDGLSPDNRMMIFDHSLKGQRLQGPPRLRNNWPSILT